MAESPAFERHKRRLVLACVAIALGLALAGSLDRNTGGVIVLVGWIAAVVALHSLGRAGRWDARSDLASKHDDADVGSELR